MSFRLEQAIYHQEIHMDTVSLCVCVCVLLTHYICLVVTKIIMCVSRTHSHSPCHPLSADVTVITEC